MKRLVKKNNLHKLAGWVSLESERKLVINDEYGKGDDSKETYYQSGILSLDTLDNATGYRGEVREWTFNEDTSMSFGNYSEEQWYDFLEDIKVNGIREPIQINVNSDGSIKIYEGNHRIEAARQLELTEIPAKVYYMGQSQQDFKIL